MVEDAEAAGSMGYVYTDTQAVRVEEAETAGAYIAAAAPQKLVREERNLAAMWRKKAR